MRKGIKNLLLAISCAACFGVIGIVTYQFLNEDNPVAVSIGGPFELTHHSGKTVTDETFRGRYLLMYFGFTHCPATCPGSLLHITNVLKRLEEVDSKEAGKITPLFVSVDPDRDTPEVIARYISHFHERFEGLTGTMEQLSDMTSSYGSYFSYSSTGDGENDYTVNHSSFLYLIGPDGYYVTHFTPDESSDQIIEQISQKLDIG